MGITIAVPKKYGSVITVTINNQKYALRAGQTLSVPTEVKALLDDMERLQPKEAAPLSMLEELMLLDPDFKAENIVDGVELFGLTGTGGMLSAHPTLLPSNTWYKGQTSPTTFTEIRIVDWYVPTGAETESWNADTEDVGKIKCYVLGEKLIISGNGSGRIMANPASNKLFYVGAQATTFVEVASISGLDLLDMRNATSLAMCFMSMKKLTSLSGYEAWNVSKCVSLKNLFASVPLDGLDLSRWDVSAAVLASTVENDNKFKSMFTNGGNMGTIRLNKSFDTTLFAIPKPYKGAELGKWIDEDTGIVYDDVNGDNMFDATNDGLPNPRIAGRNITFTAVWPESEADV